MSRETKRIENLTELETLNYKIRRALVSKIKYLMRQERKKIFLKTRAEAAGICNGRAFIQEGIRETEALECEKEILGMKQPR